MSLYSYKYCLILVEDKVNRSKQLLTLRLCDYTAGYLQRATVLKSDKIVTYIMGN